MTEPTGQPDEQTTVGQFTSPTVPVYVPQQAYAYPGQVISPPQMPQAPPKRKKRTFMIISLTIVGLLVLCGGVATTAILVTSRQSGTGQDSPSGAVSGFLTAIYVDKDPTKAAQYVCADSQKSGTLTSKVNELKLADTKYRSPHYDWTTPAVDNQTKSEATVSVTVKMTTLDERTASEKLIFTTVRSHGWWVCEVRTGK